jgi:hypothetical protein
MMILDDFRTVYGAEPGPSESGRGPGPGDGVLLMMMMLTGRNMIRKLIAQIRRTRRRVSNVVYNVV